MHEQNQRIQQLEKLLSEVLSPQIENVMNTISNGADTYHVSVPEEYTIDTTLEDIASLVAKSSNAFGRASHFAGMARAEAKMARGKFERQYKRSKFGKNDAERESNAMEKCTDEHSAMIAAEAIAELAESYENATRVASESARKILDKAFNMSIAVNRETRGEYRDQDYNKGF